MSEAALNLTQDEFFVLRDVVISNRGNILIDTRLEPDGFYETGVFWITPSGKIDFSGIDVNRYSSQEEAEVSHVEMMKKWSV